MSSKRIRSHIQTVIYGIHPVLETIRAGKRRIEEIYLSKPLDHDAAIGGLIASTGRPLVKVSDREMEGLVAGSLQHQGIAARVGPFPYTDFPDLLESCSGRESLFLLLDEIQDPVNVGAILRAAECLGGDAVILTRDRCAQVTPAVEKAASGASAHVATARVTNLVRVIEQLKNVGFWIYAAASQGADSVYSVDFTGNTGLVLGAEGKGVRRLVRDNCDRLVSIPMFGRVESLNVSHAAAIFLSERRRRLAVKDWSVKE